MFLPLRKSKSPFKKSMYNIDNFFFTITHGITSRTIIKNTHKNKLFREKGTGHNRHNPLTLIMCVELL